MGDRLTERRRADCRMGVYEGAFSAGIPFLVLLGLAVVAFSIWRYRVKALREKRLREGSYVFPEDRPEWQQKPSAPAHPTMLPDVTADVDFLASGTGAWLVSGSCLCRHYFSVFRFSDRSPSYYK